MLIALDLEGTLVSNAMSIFPRPGLHTFLTRCLEHGERVVVFTAVSTPRARSIVELLANEGTAPSWFGQVAIVEWSGPYKDLRFAGIEDPTTGLLVDDLESYILPEQKAQWISIEPYVSPYSDQDRELEVTWAKIAARLRPD